MCITVEEAIMNQTITGVLVDYLKKTHTLFYQNAAENIHDGPNALILPILGAVIGEAIDTTPFNKCLNDIVSFFEVRTRGGLSKGLSKGIAIYECGAYTVIHAKDASLKGIEKALQSIQPNKRPNISRELSEWYQTYYSKPELLICCFDGSEMTEVQPIMIEYVPRDFNKVFIPGADSHDGTVPRMGKQRVSRDHKIIFGTIGDGPKFGQQVKFSQTTAETVAMERATWEVINYPFNGINCDWQFEFEEKNQRWSGLQDLVLA